MPPSLRLFLVRHGETVDNVAQLYAGSRDSALTNHGVQQAIRLGRHFQSMGLKFTHIFSSHLQRAAETAAKIRHAQLQRADRESIMDELPDVLQLPLLTEQDFGLLEGKKWYDRSLQLNMSDKEHSWRGSKLRTGSAGVETKDSMARRADSFLDGYFLPLLYQTTANIDLVVAVVSHGIFLSTLWKRLLLRLDARSVSLAPILEANSRTSLEHLGGWANTGHLELLITRVVKRLIANEHDPSPKPTSVPTLVAPDEDEDNHLAATTTEPPDNLAYTSVPYAETNVPSEVKVSLDSVSWKSIILTINGKAHLKGLKRTGGGVGSARHDASQKKIDMFFKKPKLDLI